MRIVVLLDFPIDNNVGDKSGYDEKTACQQRAIGLPMRRVHHDQEGRSEEDEEDADTF
jgi:hypothetical protein